MTAILQNDAMLTREQLVAHFTKKYEDNNSILKAIEEKSTEELQNIYTIENKRDENELHIIENGSEAFIIDFDEKYSKDIQNFMHENGMCKYYRGDFQYNFGNDGRLYFVPEMFIKELEKHFNVKKSTSIHILGLIDIEKIQTGDKVKIITNSIFGKESDQGTVTFIEDGEIVIRKYRARKNGYSFMAGDEVQLIKIDKFE